MRIKKVINNSILCAVDGKGNEVIITGRGIGYQRKVGEIVDETQIEKTYHMEGKKEQKKLRELVEQIPLEHLRLVSELIEYIREQISQELNESLLITLADHISFAIKRKEMGIEFTNPLSSAIMCYYPTEYSLGQRCLQIIEEEYQTRLNHDEAAFIALHIVNAELNTNMSEMYDITKLLDGCVRVTEFYYHKKMDRDSLNFNRFAVHLRYLLQRLLQGKALKNLEGEEDVLFREMIQKNCKIHYKCARRIATYIETEFEKSVSEEEMVYLTIHLKRLHLDEEEKKDLGE